MSFIVKINSFSNIFGLIRKILPGIKRKKKKIGEKKNRGFIDSEFVKSCHEHASMLQF